MPENSVGSRSQILGRIQTALKKPSPSLPEVALPPIFAAVNNPLERFQQECALIQVECVLTSDLAGSRAAIEKTLGSVPAGEVFLQDAPELKKIAEGWSVQRPLRWSSQGPPPETTQATVTLAEALVALTGSVLTSAACGGRGASIVPDCHIVLAKAEQIVPDLETALAQVVERGTAKTNSYVGLITGSSRTADIEKILVLGAHGPRRLVVIVQKQS